MHNNIASNHIKEFKDIDKLTKLSIILFPFMIFIGPYIKFSIINLSNVYNILILLIVTKFLMEMRYRNIRFKIIYFFMLILYALFSLLWTKYFDFGIKLILPLITSIFTMVFISGLKNNELKLLLNTMNVFTIIVIFFSLYEISTGRYYFFENYDFINIMNPYGFHYPGVFFANPNDLGQYLVMGGPLLIATYWEKNQKIFFAFTLVLIGFIIFQTGSRLSLMSLLIILIFYLFVLTKNDIILTMKIVITGIIIFLIMFALLKIGIDFLTFDVWDDYLNIDISKGYYNARSYIYWRTYQLALDNVSLGAGLGGSYYASILGPHNLFLYILCDFGILFTLGFLLLLISSFFTLYKYIKLKQCGFYLSKIMISMLLVFPLFSSISSGNEQRKVVWIVIGLLFASINNYKLGGNGFKND